MTVLDDIMVGVREDLSKRKAERSLASIEAAAASCAPARDFAAALHSEGVSLIAEVKKSSPSRGIIRADADPVDVARVYAQAGADALSVLTEGRRFGGSPRDLSDIVDALGPSRPPVLRKDFIVEPYQVYEARALGADCILLIVALLEREQLHDLLQLSHAVGMACLVEAHDEEEVDRAVDSGAAIVGINNRNLKTLEVDLATFERLRPRVPQGRVVVGESGIRCRGDIERLRAYGVDAVLVGEALMIARDVSSMVRALRCTT